MLAENNFDLKLNEVINNISIGVVFQNADGAIIYANKSAELILGLSLEQMQGLKSVDPNWKAIKDDGTDFPGEEHPAMLSLKSGEVIENVMMGVFHPKENQYRWIKINAYPQFKNDEPSPYQVYTLFEDITSEYELLNNLSDSESKLSNLINNIPGMIYRANSNWETTFINNCFEITGYYESEFLEKKVIWGDLIYNEDKERIYDLPGVENLFESIIQEYRIVNRDGFIRWVRDHKKMILDENGEIELVEGILFDITDQKIIEEELTNNEEKFRGIFEQSPYFMGLLTPDGILIDANQTALSFIDAKKEDVLHNYFWETPWWNHSSQVQQNLKEAISKASKGEVVSYDTTHLTPNNEVRYINFAIKPIYDKKGSIIYLIPQGLDITPLVEANKAMREKENNLNEAQKIAKLGHWKLNIQTNLLEWSDEIYRIFEIDKEKFEASYEAFLNGIHPEDREMVNTAYLHSLETKEPYSITHKLLMPDNRIKYVNEKCYTLYDDNGKPLESIGTVQDITEQFRTELDLLKKEAAIESSMNAIALADLDGNLTYVNKAFENMWGYNRDECVGKSAVDFWFNPKAVNKVLEKLFTDGGTEGELIAKRKDGSTFLSKINTSLVKDKDGNQISLMGVFEDITQQSENKKMLQKLSAAIEQSNDTIFITNRNGVIEYVNPALLDIYGYTQEELIGKNPRLFKSGIKDQDFYKDMWEQILEGKIFRAEVINKRKNSTFVYEDRVITPLKDENGNVTHFLSVGRDITEKKSQEVKLRKEERRYKSILDTALDGFIITDMHGKIMETNQAYCDMVGYSREEILKMSVSQLEVIESHEEILKRVKKILETGFDHFKSMHRKKDGSLLYIEANTSKIEYEGEKVIAFMKDISDLTELESDILIKNTLLDSVNIPLLILSDKLDIKFCNKDILEELNYLDKDEFLQNNSSFNSANSSLSKFIADLDNSDQINENIFLIDSYNNPKKFNAVIRKTKDNISRINLIVTIK